MSSFSACGSGSKADVVFILDASGSVGPEDFSLLLTFVSNVLEEWDIDQEQIRIGMLRFATDHEVLFQLKEYDDKDDLIRAVGNIQYTGGYTHTGREVAGMKV